jgi:hypothetical protein
MPKVTVTESITIAASPEAVWDYTQDWTQRTTWDPAVREVIAISEGPRREVRARFSGGVIFDVVYKLIDRPHKTSLAMAGGSTWFVGGGGSWRYEAEGSGTRWGQTNTLVTADRLVMRLLSPFVRATLRRQTRRAMQNVKARFERASPARA